MATKGKFRTILWRLFKWFGITFAVLLLIFSIVSWVIVKQKNAWLLQEIQTYANQSQSGQLKIAAIDLRLFKNLPYVTLELNGVDYFERPDSIRRPDEPPILHADHLFVAVELLPLLEEQLNVSKIGLAGAQLNIIEYQDGMLNVDKALAKPAVPAPLVVVKDTVQKPAPKPVTVPPTPKVKPDSVARVNIPPPPKSALQIDLDLISLDETLISWKSFISPKPSVIFIKELEVGLARNDSLVSARLQSDCEVRSVYLNKSSLPSGKLTLKADLDYATGNQVLRIRDGKVVYKLFTATIQGTYAHAKKRRLDLNVDASSNALRMLSLIVKPDLIRKHPDVLEHGELYLKGKVFGELEKQSPQVDMFFGVRNLTLKFPIGKFENVDIDGRFVSGSAPDFSQARFDIKKLNGQLPGGFLKGEFHLANFVEPDVKYDVNAQLRLDGYDQVFQIDDIKQLTGTVSVQANFDGPLKAFAEHGMDSSRSSSITLDSLSFVVAKTNKVVSGLSGKIRNKNNQATIEQLSFQYGNNEINVNATIDNLVYFIVKGEQDIAASGKLSANQIYTRDFILDTLLSAEVDDRMSNVSFGFNVTTTGNKSGYAMPDITFDIDSLSAGLDKLPDIKMLSTAGTFSQTSEGLKLILPRFHATLPQGKVDVAGDLLVRTSILWEFNAKVKTDKFPWTYVTELAAEIKEDAAPKAKNLPVSAMELATVDLDLSASLITYPFDINRLDIRNSRGSLIVPGSKPISVDKINVALQNLNFKHPENSGAITGMKSTKGTVELMQFSAAGLNAMDIKTNVSGEDDKLKIGFSGVVQRALSQKGEFVLDFSQKELEYHLKYIVQGASLDYFMQRFYKKKFMDGTIDYSLDIRTHGSTWAQAKQGLSGEIEISGDSLRLYGVDIDDVLRKYKNSQNFNLTDVGAVLIAGPIGLAVTKGSDFVSLATINFNQNQQTNIKTLVTKWKLENLQLTTQDVAFSTPTNRVAFDGQIDFGRDSIPGITISVVDKNGCSLMDQKMYGKMGKLQTGKLNITKTLLGSVINFANAVVGKDCKPVYTGTVKDPASGR